MFITEMKLSVSAVDELFIIGVNDDPADTEKSPDDNKLYDL